MSEPWIDCLPQQLLALVLGYGLTLAGSGPLVRYFVGSSDPQDPKNLPEGRRFDPHAVIGKCENILALTFIIAGALTGLALIFAAKSIIRAREENADYYLGGTLVNLVWSVLMGVLLRLAVVGPLG